MTFREGFVSAVQRWRKANKPLNDVVEKQQEEMSELRDAIIAMLANEEETRIGSCEGAVYQELGDVWMIKAIGEEFVKQLKTKRDELAAATKKAEEAAAAATTAAEAEHATLVAKTAAASETPIGESPARITPEQKKEEGKLKRGTTDITSTPPKEA